MAWYEVQIYKGDDLGWVKSNGIRGRVYDSIDDASEELEEIPASYLGRIVEIKTIKEKGYQDER